MVLPESTAAIAVPALLGWFALAGTCRGYGQCEYGVTPIQVPPCVGTRTNRYRGRFSIRAHAPSAELVECRRVNGKPRQRFLAHPGTLEVWDDAGTGDIAIGTGGNASRPCVVAIWRRVSLRLDMLCERFDWSAVEGMIAAKMPRLHIPMSSVMKITSHMPSRKCQYMAV